MIFGKTVYTNSFLILWIIVYAMQCITVYAMLLVMHY